MNHASPLSSPALESEIWHGTTVWTVRAQGAGARISAHGGQLLSWQPAPDDEVLWLSAQLQPLPTPLRGGVPLCWPWFGRPDGAPELPAHGLARTALWEIRRSESLPDGRVELELAPSTPLHPWLEVWQVLRVGQTLEQELHTRHRGTEPYPLSQALHSYFRLDALADALLLGLEGTAFHDALHPGLTGSQQGTWQWDRQQDQGRQDRIYPLSGQRLRLERGLRRPALHIDAVGASSLVLWTPGPVLGPQMPDVGEGWQHYLCLEVAHAGDHALTLRPGQAVVLGQRLALA